MTDLDALRHQAERVATLYGSGGVPPDDLLPADRLWFLVMDAADEIERLRAENERLQELLDAYAAAHDRLVAGACTAPDRAADGEAFDAAQEAILAAATKEDERG